MSYVKVKQGCDFLGFSVWSRLMRVPLNQAIGERSMASNICSNQTKVKFPTYPQINNSFVLAFLSPPWHFLQSSAFCCLHSLVLFSSAGKCKMQFLKDLFDFFEKKSIRDQEFLHVLVFFPPNGHHGWSWARLKLGPQNSIWVSLMGGPCIWALFCWFPWCVSKQLSQHQQRGSNQHSDMGRWHCR